MANDLAEYADLKQNGFEVRGQHFRFGTKYFSCDAPLRQFLKCIKEHTNYFSCKGYLVEEEYTSSRVILNYINADLGNGNEFN